MLKLVPMGLLLLALAVPCAYGAEAPEVEEPPAEPVVEEEPLTQGQFAVLIIRMLGLESELDETVGTDKLGLRGDVTELAAVDECRRRGLQPLGGWKPTEMVTKEVVAVIAVQALGLLRYVENPDNPDDYIAVLEERDILLTSVRDVLSEIEVVNPVVQILRGTSLSYEDNLSPTRGR